MPERYVGGVGTVESTVSVLLTEIALLVTDRDNWRECALKAEKDSRRLDWLDSTQFPEDISAGGELKWQISPIEGDSIRDAIDGATDDWFSGDQGDLE